MTYEKFCNRVLELYSEDKTFSRKTVAKMAFGVMAYICELALAVGYLVGCIAPNFSLLTGIGILVALTFTMFEYISDEKEICDKWLKISKLWWLGLIITIAAIVIMRMFLR